MPFNLLDLIKGEGAVVSFVRSAVETGKAATETLESLRALGMGIRTESFYKVYNYFAGPVTQTRNYISNIGLQNLPNIARLPPSLTKLPKNFYYELKIEVVSSETGEKKNVNLNISTNTLLSKQQAIDEIADRIDTNPNGRYPYTFSGAQVVNIFQNSAGVNEELL